MLDSNFTQVLNTSIEQLQDSQMADPNAVTDFEQAMQQNVDNGLGESVLDQIVDMKKQISGATESLKTAMSSGIDDPAALMEIQWALTRITMQEELIAKTAGKTSQNVETLMKAQ
ncbi:type III secretion system inner rod subunit SctI [Shewanella sp. VB17]|uniref:type III secretion system inner rod subunit SctI n=1 Tax=Shewanella sp. VB17 TaxID=2739432 RepID=UPI001564738A|nr:type III secretion system inner rod subunit SctI [Shewanella sp. VB17]NRD71731.1 type III secretion system inner rod subunit SctI [Shewanella sp. VB17]